MEYIHTRDSLPRLEWPRPDSVTERVVCEISGLLPTRYCPQTRELFLVDPSSGIDTQPVQADAYWTSYAVNVCTGRLANATSAQECVEDIVYFDYPSEVRAWARETGQRFPPTDYDVAVDTSPSSPVTIISPPFLARVRGEIEVRGNISDENFAYYRLDYGAGTQPDVWLQIGEQRSDSGRDIELSTWDTTGLSDGAIYTLRLTMVRNDNSLETAYVSVTVDNQPPTVTLSEPLDGSRYTIGETVYIPLQAEPEDNVQMAYVEYYRDGERIATVEEWPYTARMEVEEPGTFTLWATAYDAAGNSADSGQVVVGVD